MRFYRQSAAGEIHACNHSRFARIRRYGRRGSNLMERIDGLVGID